VASMADSPVLLAPPLAELVAEADISADGEDLRELLVAAQLDEPVRVDRSRLREIEAHAGLLLLTLIAAGRSGDLDQEVARLLGEVGWARPDGTPVCDAMAALAVFGTRALLTWPN
jgi:hypothetical protein